MCRKILNLCRKLNVYYYNSEKRLYETENGCILKQSNLQSFTSFLC